MSTATTLRKIKSRLPAPVATRLSRPRRTTVLAPGALPFMKPSFSQLGEDLIVRHLFDDLGVPTPSYFDIGAHHPYEISNTALMHLAGGTGINVEPDPRLFEEFVRSRPDAINLNVGVAAVAGELTFYRMSAAGVNTFSAEAAAEVERESGGRIRVMDTFTVPVLPAATILTEHFGGRCPDFLSLDVEGLDQSIVDSMATWPALPTVVCVETTTYSERGRGRKLTGIVSSLESQGYMLYADTYVNSVFVLRRAYER